MSADYSDWTGRQETRSDILDPARSNALRAALGASGALSAGDALPLLHHWLYFWDVHSPDGLGTDGHPKRGGFLPPVELPRRMWNGIRENTDPTVAAAAVVLMAVTLAAFAIWVLAQRQGRSTHEETASER